MFKCKMLIATMIAFASFWALTPAAHAENGCPEGQIPVQNANDVAYTCTNIQDYEASQRAPARPTIWVDVYSAVAWHPQVADVWAVWNVRNEQGSGNGAESYVMEACTRDMGGGCILAGSAVGGTIAVARTKTGTMRAAFGNTAGKAKAQVMSECAAAEMGCTFLKSFTSKSWKEYENSNSNERYNRLKSYSPTKALVGVPKTYAQSTAPASSAPSIMVGAAAFNQSTKPLSQKIWLSGGHPSIAAARQAALNLCQKDVSNGCFVFLTNANGYILAGVDDKGNPRGNEGPNLQAAEMDAAKLCNTCKITVRFDVTKPESKVVDLMNGAIQR